jgi:hypothetical protein
VASAQTLTERNYLIRAETTVTGTIGMTETCVLVLADGQYRLERSHQSDAVTGTTWAYSDVLPEGSMKQLRAVLADSQFQAINVVNRIPLQTYDALGGSVTGYIGSLDTLVVSIPREHSVQKFAFMNSEQRKPYEKQLKPFEQWFKDLQRKKSWTDKNAIRTNCMALSPRPPQP